MPLVRFLREPRGAFAGARGSFHLAHSRAAGPAPGRGADASTRGEMVTLNGDCARRWKPYMRPCELSTQSMLKQLPDILMPEQRERYAAQLKGYLEAMELRRQLNEAEMRR